MTGDQNDMLTRLQRLIPNGWFPAGAAPIRDALLTGSANLFAFIYSLLAYVKLQTRIATATDGWLDLIAYDFFGSTLLRQPNQTDTSFRLKILSNMFREKGTRKAVTAILVELTGQVPVIFEPSRIADTGALDVNFFLDINRLGDVLPYQSFVTAFTGGSVGAQNVSGYRSPEGGWRTPSRAAYSRGGTGQLTYADIYAAIDSVRPIAYTIWVQIVEGNSVAPNTSYGSFDSTVLTFDSTALTFDSGTGTGVSDTLDSTSTTFDSNALNFDG